MNTNPTSDSPSRARIHPLVAAAAVAVTLASATGIAAMTGWLPTSHANTASGPQPASAVVAQAGNATPDAEQPQPYVERRQIAEEAPRRAPSHHRRVVQTEPAPRYASGDVYRSPAEPAAPTPVATAPTPVAADPNAGEVVAINAVQTPEPSTGLGALGGAVAGGLIGNQVGQGRGRMLATLAGALGGGLAGNGIEHVVRKATTYQVQVRMSDGSYRNFNYPTQPAVQIGERVHVSGETLSAA